MFASFLSQKRMNPQDPEAARVHSYSALARMFTLIGTLPEERQWQVFRQLHNEKLPNALLNPPLFYGVTIPDLQTHPR